MGTPMLGHKENEMTYVTAWLITNLIEGTLNRPGTIESVTTIG